MKKNLLLVLLSILTVTWSMGQKAPEKELFMDINEKTVIDLSDFSTSQIVENSSVRGALNEGFEGTDFPPIGWKVINDGDTYTWDRFADSYIISGTASAGIRYHSSVAHDDWLITPPLLPVAGNDSISFSAKHRSSYPEEFYVWVSNTGNNKEDFTQLAGPISTTSAAQTFAYSLSAYHGDTVYFAVQATSLNAYYLYVDDFVGPEVYIPPTNLAVTGGNKDYRLIPLSQLNSALTLNTIVTNKGVDLTENVNVIAAVKNASNETVFTTTDVLTGLNYGATQTVSAATPFDATTLPVGDYSYTHTADYAADADPTDNTDSFNFSVNDYIYARDVGVFAENGVGSSSRITFGNLYAIESAATVTGVQFVWPALLSEATASYQLALYRVDSTADLNVQNPPIFQTDTYQRDQSQAGQTMNIPVRPTVIQQGLYVLAMKQTTTTNIAIAYDNAEHGYILRANNEANPAKFSAKILGFGHISLRMDLTPKTIVAFNVSDGTNPIEGATVTVKQGETVIGTAESNASGLAEIYTAAGNYTYSVTAVGYNPQNDVSLVVTTTDMTVDVTMTLAPPILEVTPDTFTFPDTHIDMSSAPQTFTIQNIGAGELIVNPSDITITGTNADLFTLTTIENPDTLGLGETATFTVVFNPTTVGEKTATINVNSTAGSKTIAINGNAIDLTVTQFPFIETFDEDLFPPLGWLSLGTRPWDRVTNGTNPSCDPFGVGMIRYNCFSISSGNQGTLVTRRLNMGTGNYSVGFKMFRDNYSTYSNAHDRVDVYANTSPDTTGGTLLGTIYRYTDYEPVVTEQGWYDYDFEIPAEYVSNLSYVVFLATSDWGTNIFVDEIIIGQKSTVTLVANPTEGGTVSGGGEYLQGTEIELVATPNADYSFVNWTNEANEVLSTSATYLHVVVATETITANFEIEPPFNVTAAVVNNNQALVTWNTYPESFVDSIESYEDFIIANIGNYTLVDVDGSPSYGIQNVTFPNSGYTGSYIVFNPSGATPALSDNWTPHSGSKYLACFAATSGPNNDWLITHQVSILPGMNFSFWARSLTVSYGPDRFKIGVSTTGTEPADFTFITGSGYVAPPDAWTQYTYNLDAYAGQDVYLAINCVSDDSFVLMIDDIFIGGSKSNDSKDFVGYKVYLNDQEVASGLTENQYTVTDIPVGDHTIGVQSVYTAGSSSIVYSNPITVYPPDFAVTFTVTCDEQPLEGAVVTVNSQEITTDASGVATINLANGEYTYTVTKLGYADVTGSFEVFNAEVNEAVSMELAPFAITFHVDHDGAPLQGVTILVDGKVLTTNAQGNAIAQLVNGSYTYKAVKSGYNDVEGSLVVDNADQTVNLSMIPGIGGFVDSYVRLYPNPVGNTLTIERNNSNEVVIELYNSSGALISTMKTEDVTTNMDVEMLSSGSYFVRIIGVNNTTTHKFIKQ
ncbi:MAG: choice-of-anchor D domain-containing protein [Bacteroidales bacterium]|nr:choice-of-anchor D domain-containing protein [Bacteroidales bacterium]